MTLSDWIATRYACRCKFPERCKGAAWTAQITLLLPASLVVILTSAFWKILTEFLARLPGKDALSRAHTTPINIPKQLANLLPHGISKLQETGGDHNLTVQGAIRTMINAQGDDLVFLCIVLGRRYSLGHMGAFARHYCRSPAFKKTNFGEILLAGFNTLRRLQDFAPFILPLLHP